MKLKPTVALSISVLGLASTMAYAAVGAGSAQEADSKARVAKLESVLDRNQGQAVSFGKLPVQGWEKRITISGLANGDATWSNRTPVGDKLFASSAENDKSYNDLGVANTNLFVDAKVNGFTFVHGALAYWGAGQDVNAQPHKGRADTLYVDEAYVYMHDFAHSPLYARVGIQYVDSGFYSRFPVVAPFTQMLTQTRATALTVGVNSAAGYNVSLFVFNGANKANETYKRRINAGGISASYNGVVNDLGLTLGLSYMNDMANTDYVGTVGNLAEIHGKRIGTLAGHVGLDYASFDLAFDYAGATSRFDITDLGAAQQVVTKGAKPHAIHAEVGYKPMTLGRKSRVSLGYGVSWDSVNIMSGGSDVVYAGLPKHRYMLAYNVELAEMTDVTIVLRRDKDYKVSKGGTGLSSTTGVLRLGVKFA